MNAGRLGIVVVGDLWNWVEARWWTCTELQETFGVNRSTAEILAQSTVCTLAPRVVQAMLSDTALSPGDWVATNTVHVNGSSGSRQCIGQISQIQNGMAHLRQFEETPDGSLQKSTSHPGTIIKLCAVLTLVTVLTHGGKCRWLAAWENPQPHPQDQEQAQRLVWHEQKATSQLLLDPAAWRWNAVDGTRGMGPSLLNFSAPWAYKVLVRQVKIPNRNPFSASWELPVASQLESLRLMWRSPGVAPKAAAVAWRVTQRALPNDDRWTGLLELFDYDTCHACSAQAKITSEHLFFECSKASGIWCTINQWVSSHTTGPARHIDRVAALHGLDSGSSRPRPFRQEQWWPVLWRRHSSRCGKPGRPRSMGGNRRPGGRLSYAPFGNGGSWRGGL